MIHRLQHQWCIWPESCEGYPHSAPNAKKWDKVIGLVPQQDCLFKLYYYQSDLVSQGQIDQCVENELKQLIDWVKVDYYTWVNKVNDSWQVAVWFWNPENITFKQELTHCLPAMVYNLGRVSSARGMLFYSESLQNQELIWAISWETGKVFEQLHPLSSQLHRQRAVNQARSSAANLFANNESLILLEGLPLASLAEFPSGQVLSKAKCSNQFDLDNPWQYWQTMLALVLVLVLYLVADAALINYKLSQTESQLEQVQQSTQDLQRYRQSFSDTERFVNNYVESKARQQAPAKLIDSLTTKLAKDIVLTRITFQNDKVVLQGTILDTAGLLDNLTSVIGVKEAKLIGEVTSAGEGRQEFRAELLLEEAHLWKN
ncbi:hypothetical protein [Vibrio vulnificus]|uniref:Uncharacterized protein n=1 Tax=Vibrio vulnificus TaxID=672 RepID=A0A2S3R5Y7_VIBVL|nr:hypothetical protein [Vibrio vulnificus]POB49114.1 hypothetical protein CRN52_06500 [Vibrio vulnificus]